MQIEYIQCSDCGFEIDSSSKYCDKCGEEIPIDYDTDTIIDQVDQPEDRFPLWYYILGMLFPYIGLYIIFLNYNSKPVSSRNLLAIIIGGAVLYLFLAAISW